MGLFKKESQAQKFYVQRIKAANWPQNDLCDPPTSDREAMQALIDHLLWPNWYVTMPESREQTNTAAVCEIIRRYVDDSPGWLILIPAAFAFLAGLSLGIILF